MRTKSLLLALAFLLSGCALFAKTAPEPEEDTSIRFPEFHARPATLMGGQGQPFELDGVTLRAIAIAANDFNPPKGGTRECWEKQESHRYRVIREDEVIFVEISLDTSACGHGILDGGVKYAIRSDGHILRRLFDGEPEPQSSEVSGREGSSEQGTPVPDSEVGSTAMGTGPGLPPSWLQRAAPDAGVPAPGDAGL